MLSDDKMTHIVHLMLDGLERAGMVSYPSKEVAVREAKVVCLKHMGQLNKVGELAEARIRSQKNAPLEHSPQWETLYQKYYEEEMRKLGG